MTTVFLVIVNDRHIDTEVKVFSNRESAINYAKVFADEARRGWPIDQDDQIDEKALKRAGWIWYQCYSCEGDSLWVVEEEVKA